jgi:hypothetical protein
VVKRVGRLAVLGPLAMLTLSVACTQVLDIQDAWIDPSLSGGTSASNGGTSSVAGAGHDAGGSTAGSGHNHGGGPSDQAGTSAVGASAGTDASEAGAGGDGPNPPKSTCDAYCDLVLANCTGKYEQYRNRTQCLEVCKRLPEGAPGDDLVNTVQCRIAQAGFAESEAFHYCKSAGPLGEGRCGSNCAAYCSLMDATCTKTSTDGNIELSYFEDTAACLANCSAMATDPSAPPYYSSSATIEPNSLVGNNIYCRTYHVAAGIEQDTPSEHCPHAMGGDPCIAQ